LHWYRDFISTDGLPFEAFAVQLFPIKTFAVQLSPFEAFGVQLTKISWTKGEMKALCNMTSVLTRTRNTENPLTFLLLRKVILFLLHLQSQSTTAVLIELMNTTACIGLSFVNLNAAIEGEGSADKCIGSGSRRRWLWWWPWMTHCSRNCNCTDTAVEHVACTKKMVGGGGGGEVRDISVEMTVRGRIFELDFYFSAAIQNISTSQPANEVTKQTNQHSP
jgi:hypothetical protein